ncbi:hypothetical protein A3K80_01305 [Candidatus Bathyarchaeota archaeon RBG_13_38_9]|nr:MAG: hypothetical protein A3K80_01305 [Candidatus Bathyarchaeota archaeon RBG_13_38_9]
MNKILIINQSVLDSILSYAKMAYPKESILILQGKTTKKSIEVNEVIIPPFATHGQGFSSFSPFMLPISFSIVGVAHSHPSGVLLPSTYDLNHVYGKFMIIVVYPFETEDNIAVFNKDGNQIQFEIADDT